MELDEEELKATKNREKTADKMFDEIGFNKYEYNNKIEYLSREKTHEITFYKDRKEIDSRCGIGSEFISMQELQAINKKVGELRLEIEVWKDIPSYEGLYQASNLGRIKSLKRYKKNHSKLQLVEEKILTQNVNKRNGYMYVVLTKQGKEKNCRVHRLIAYTFIDNPNNYQQVNHKNGTKTDNRIENLEWCTNQENVKHAFKTGLNSNKNKIRIGQYSKAGELIQEYNSIDEASKKTGFSLCGISMCINGKQKTCHKYIFRKLV